MLNKIRCFGNKPGQEYYALYHDEEWGVPVYDDVRLFEMLILEGAQAGLSWETVLKKREGYRDAFYNFSIEKVAHMSDDELQLLCTNPAIIRNRLKIYSARKNARVCLLIQKEFGSFNEYLWRFVNHTPLIQEMPSLVELPVKTSVSDALSKDLKRRGMTFVGSTIMYAFMQAVGMTNDHIQGCWLAQK